MFIDTSSRVFTLLKIFSQGINPALLIALIVGLVVIWRQERSRFWPILIATALSISLTYLIKNVEGHNDVWANWGMDFSSHSALAIACCVALAFIWQHRWWIFSAIFIAYAIFMMIMQFHTLADILSTSAIIFPLCWICQFVAWRRNRATKVGQT